MAIYRNTVGRYGFLEDLENQAACQVSDKDKCPEKSEHFTSLIKTGWKKAIPNARRRNKM
jgi:hypothetical protein